MECLRSITPLAHLTLPKRQQNRIRDLRSKFARTRGQSRSSTAIEHPKKFGRRGFDSHRARQFRRAAEFGLSAKRETASAFIPRTIGQLMDSHLASCPSFLFGMGRCALVIELGSSNARERLVQTRRYGFDSRPETSKPPLVHPSAFSTGRRIGLSLITTWSPVRVRLPAPRKTHKDSSAHLGLVENRPLDVKCHDR